MPKILVIEDKEAVRENILDLLETEGFETIAAANGRIGVHIAVKEIPSLILCDIMMPELDGYGVITALRQNPLSVLNDELLITMSVSDNDEENTSY